MTEKMVGESCLGALTGRGLSVARMGSGHRFVFLIGVAVFAATWLSVILLHYTGGLVLLWPVNAIIVAAMVRTQRRQWPLLITFGFASNFLGNLAGGNAAVLSLALATFNNAEAFVCGYAVTGLLKAPSEFAGRRDFWRFALICLPTAIVSSLIASSFYGVYNRPHVVEALIASAMADGLGLLVVTPALLSFASSSPHATISRLGRWKSLALIAGLAAINCVVFSQSHFALLLVVLAPMIMLVFELGMLGATVGLIITTVAALGYMVAGHGTVAPAQGDRIEGLLSLQIFLVAAAFVNIAVAATLEQARRFQDAQSESEARYRMLADHAIDVVVRYDPQGRIVYASPSLSRFGHEPEDLVGREIGNVAQPGYRDRFLQRFTDTLAGKPDKPEEWRTRAADERWVWIEGQFSALRDANGAIIGVLLTLRDVELRKTAEAALQEVNAELTRVARVSALGAFSASLAHEINQPLAALVANSQAALHWLDRDPPDLREVEKAIRRSERDAQRASDIVERLRAMVTREAPTLVDFDLNDAVREALALIQSELQRWSIAAEIGLSEGPLWVHGDRILLQQVLMNLILNAIEAMHAAPAGERLLIIRSATGAEGQVRVEVEDRGSGIEPGAADRMFDILFSTKQGGSGLGLSISQSIIESHGGRIWAEPAEPRGAILAFQILGAGRDAAA